MINLPLALRSLLKSPLVTGVAVLSLALGIGANAAIFSIFERVLLRPLPVESPSELVNLSAPGPKPGSQSTGLSGDMDSVFSYPMFRDLEQADSAFESIAAHRSFGVNLAYEGATSSGLGSQVSGSYFGTLGLRPAAGRLIAPSDDETPGGHPVVVLSHAYWRTRFDLSEAVLGKALTLNGKPLTIIGVAPEGFVGTTLGQKADVFVPLSMREELVPGWKGLDDRQNYWVYCFGRLSDGASIEQAQASLGAVYSGLIRDVELPLQEDMSDSGRERFAAKTLELEPGARGQSGLHGETRSPLLLLLGVTGFVLLIACANIANLLLVKATNRAGEIAVRMSIGAQRHQLVSQFLTESFLLSAAGGVLGFFVAHATTRLMSSALPVDAELGLDTALGPVTWMFLLVLSAITGLVGLFPALHSTRAELVSALKYQAGKTSPSKAANRFRAAMVTLQIALSMALLVSAGLFTKSLLNVARVDLGLNIENMITFMISPELNGYDFDASRELFVRVEQEVAALPGVSDVAASMVPLIAGNNWGSNVSVEGFERGPDIDSNSRFNAVGPGYFRKLKIPILAGREFTENDAQDATEVVIVNETFAEKFGLGRDAVGKRMAVGATKELDLEIVGLVADSKYSEVKMDTPPLFILPYRQQNEVGRLAFYVRSPLDPQEVIGMVRGAVAGLDPNLPLEEVRTMQTQVAENVFLDRMMSTLSAAFAVLATLLAAVGLYGVMAYSVSQRTREIGLRMALGADARRVRALVLRQVGGLTVAGAVIGLLAAWGLGKAASSLLYGLDGNDPLVFGAAALVLIVVAVGAGLVPAQRAANTDPLVALRDE